MSSKGGSAVAERRLRPLWDAIDSRQYKTALKLANSLLSKHPDSVYLIVLKALTLERMGKPEESLTLCEKAKALGPVDDLTLSTLQIVFQRLRCSEQATLCYEHACSKSPNNIELMMGLFNCYVRDYSFLKQQQIAMKMHKLFGEERFLLWAVCSIQLQVCCGTGDKTLLSLAEALLKKRLDMHGFDELEALLVYIDLLEYEGRFETALDVLSKLAGLFSMPLDKLILELPGSDNWAAFLQYLDATLEVPFDGISSHETHDGDMILSVENVVTSLTDEEAESRLQKVSALLQTLQNQVQHELRRGPFLGNIEIEKRRFLLQLRKGNSPVTAASLHSSLEEYFERFGHMVSFASDIQDYLEFIRRYCPDGFLERVYEAHRKSECELPVKLFRRKISLFQMEMQLASKATDSDKGVAARAIEIAHLYVEGLKLSKDLDPQENMHGEELLTMAASSLIQLFLRTKHPGFFIEAILLLEFGLAVRKYSFQYKIMLVSLYSALFCVSAAFEWYKTLDVKNILIETMPHHILHSLIRSMMWDQLDSTLTDITKFHEDYAKEAADLVILAYRHCNYSKVLEFVQFKDRLQRSHNLLLSKVEGTILQLKQKADNIDDVMVALEKMSNGNEVCEWAKDEHVASLSFNEALETRPWWSPAPGECALSGTADCEWRLQQKEPKERLHQRQEIWRQHIRKRSLLPRLLYLSMGVVSSSELNREAVKSQGEELEQLTRKYVETLNLQWEKVPDLLTELSSGKNLFANLSSDASDIFSLALFWTAEKIASGCSIKALSELRTLATKLITELTSHIKISNEDLKLSHTDMIASWTDVPSIICNVSEALTWYSLCLEMWIRSLQPVAKAGKKKKKGAAAVSTGHVLADPNMHATLHMCAGGLCHELESLITWLTGLSNALQASSESIYLDILKGGEVNEVSVIPGAVLHAVQSTPYRIEEMGERISTVFQTWQPESGLRKVVDGQSATLHDLNKFLRSRLSALQGFRC